MWNGDLWCCDDVNDLMDFFFVLFLFFIRDQNETIQLLRCVCLCVCVLCARERDKESNRNRVVDVCM